MVRSEVSIRTPCFDFNKCQTKRAIRLSRPGLDPRLLRPCSPTTMTVKWLMHWQPNHGTTLTSQILTEVCLCAEGLNGVKDGRWKSVMTFYRPVLRDQSLPVEYRGDLIGLSLHEQPSKYYLTPRGQRIVLEADASILAVFEKLQSYKNRIFLTFEGFQYKLGDFQLRVGKCTTQTGEGLRGIMMEVEYLPLSSIEKSKQILEDFYDIWQKAVEKKSLPGHFMHIEPNFAEYGLLDHYTPQHTAVQYSSCMQQLMAAVSVRN